MAMKRMIKRQKIIYKTLHRKLMIEIEQNKPHKNRVVPQVLWKGKQFLLHLMALIMLLLNNMDIRHW